MMWGYSFNWLNMTLMMLGSTIWIVLLIGLAWAMIRWLNHRTIGPTRQINTLGDGPMALEILSRRYAQGEIDETTFEQMRARLATAYNAYQKNGVEIHQPVGERLFDGRTNGSEIL